MLLVASIVTISFSVLHTLFGMFQLFLLWQKYFSLLRSVFLYTWHVSSQ